MNRTGLLLIAIATLVFLVAGAAAGLAVAHTGRPSYCLGEVPDRFIPEANRWFYHSGGQPFFQLGLWHASLCTFLIGLCFRLSGPENWAGRLTGALCRVAVGVGPSANGFVFLVCWMKEFAGGYLVVVLAGYEILARRWRRLAALLVAGVVAAGLSTAAWTAFCHVLGDFCFVPVAAHEGGSPQWMVS